mgnify:CR=1 FL=1
MVLMTADITAELKHRNRRSEFTAYLDKPIDVSELKKVIETYLPVAERRDFLLHAQMNHGAYRRLLQTFLQETGSLAAELPGYVPEQLELFGTKVHGIKGASQQIGRQALSESAEIMEMAAKQKISGTWKAYDRVFGDDPAHVRECRGRVKEHAAGDIRGRDSSRGRTGGKAADSGTA